MRMFLTALFCGMVFFAGCVINPIPFYGPDKLESQPNTFKITRKLFFLYSKADEDIITGVSVEESTEEVKVWEIKAVRDIEVTNFKVTVGEVPEGFEQVLPEPNEKFMPVQGRGYLIYIHTKFEDDPEYSPHIDAYGWTAEPSDVID